MNRFDRRSRLWRFVETLLYCTLLLVGVGGCLGLGQFFDPDPPSRRAITQRFKYKGKRGRVRAVKSLFDNEIERVDVFDESNDKIPIPAEDSPITLSPTGQPKWKPGVELGDTSSFIDQNVAERFYVLDTLGENRILAFSMETYQLVQEFPLPATLGTNIGRFDLTDDGALFWSAVSEGPRSDFGTPVEHPRLIAIDTLTGQTTRSYELPFGSNVRDVDVSPDGQTVYVLDAGIIDREFEGLGIRTIGSEIFAIDAATGEIVSRLQPLEPYSHFEHLAITPDGEMLFAYQVPRGLEGKDAVLIFETVERSLVDKIETRVQIEDGTMIFNHTGSVLYILRDSRVVASFNTATGAEIAQHRIEPITPQYRFNSLALSLDGGSLFLNDQTNEVVYRLDAINLNVLETFQDTVVDAPEGSRLFIIP